MHLARRSLSGSILWLTLVIATPAAAQAPDSDAPVTVLETVVVSGEQPGPGLWKISRGDHVLWVLGTINPLPKRMQWNSDEVESVVAASEQVLLSPGISVAADVGFFGTLALLPSAMKARNSPDKQTLDEVLPPELYQRWTVMKQRYLGRSRSVEKRRPILAIGKLYDKVLAKSDLKSDDRINKVVRRAAKRADREIIKPEVSVKIAEPKALLKQLAETSLDDVDCFDTTLRQLETDVETMKLRANAWALGEIEILRSLPLVDNRSACNDAILKNTLAQQHGFKDLEARLAAAWLEAAEAALKDHTQSFAVLPMGLILREDGFVPQLAAKGYLVESPMQREEAAKLAAEAVVEQSLEADEAGR